MKKLKTFVLAFALLLGPALSISSAATQLGAGYGKEFRGNDNIEQLEFFVRQSLPFSTKWGEIDVATGLELAGAIIREDHADSDNTGRFSLMPQVVLATNEMVNFVAGFGTGFMAGETEFTNHNLGGSFCFVSKVGMQLVLAKTVGLEYTFYHQSNGGIYEYNASLNMHQIALTVHF